MVTVLNLSREEIFIDEFYFYSNSQIALTWVLSIDKELKTFFQNHVNVILKNIDIHRRFYVNSSENPADIVTRFNNYSLKKNSWWLKGSRFLYLRENPYTEEVILLKMMIMFISKSYVVIFLL